MISFEAIKKPLIISASLIAVIGGGVYAYRSYKLNDAAETCVISVVEDHPGDYKAYRPCMIKAGYPKETFEALMSRGGNPANRMNAHLNKFADDKQREKALSDEAALADLNSAYRRCKEKYDVFETARKDGDYQLSMDLFEVYRGCMHTYGYEVGPWSKEIFEGKNEVKDR